MMKYVWSFLGFGGTVTERKVVGAPAPIDQKEVEYIRESNARLNVLHHLANRYRGTAHEPKLKAVFEKTKNIHAYLVSKKRPHELELFHVQHTDHFINTFTAILEVHQSHQAASMPPPPPPPVPASNGEASPEAKAQVLLRKFEAERVRRGQEPLKFPEMVKPFVSRQSPLLGAKELRTVAPRLSAPDILIDTYSKIIYLREDTNEGLIAHEIGFTSTEEEKQNFLLLVSARLGITLVGLTYVGNAVVNIPNSNGSTPTGYVPVIHWKGFTYALNLNDYRLFPVRIHRRGV